MATQYHLQSQFVNGTQPSGNGNVGATTIGASAPTTMATVQFENTSFQQLLNSNDCLNMNAFLPQQNKPLIAPKTSTDRVTNMNDVILTGQWIAPTVSSHNSIRPQSFTPISHNGAVIQISGIPQSTTAGGMGANVAAIPVFPHSVIPPTQMVPQNPTTVRPTPACTISVPQIVTAKPSVSQPSLQPTSNVPIPTITPTVQLLPHQNTVQFIPQPTFIPNCSQGSLKPVNGPPLIASPVMRPLNISPVSTNPPRRASPQTCIRPATSRYITIAPRVNGEAPKETPKTVTPITPMQPKLVTTSPSNGLPSSSQQFFCRPTNLAPISVSSALGETRWRKPPARRPRRAPIRPPAPPPPPPPVCVPNHQVTISSPVAVPSTTVSPFLSSNLQSLHPQVNICPDGEIDFSALVPDLSDHKVVSPMETSQSSLSGQSNMSSHFTMYPSPEFTNNFQTVVSTTHPTSTYFIPAATAYSNHNGMCIPTSTAMIGSSSICTIPCTTPYSTVTTFSSMPLMNTTFTHSIASSLPQISPSHSHTSPSLPHISPTNSNASTKSSLDSTIDAVLSATKTNYAIETSLPQSPALSIAPVIHQQQHHPPITVTSISNLTVSTSITPSVTPISTTQLQSREEQAILDNFVFHDIDDMPVELPFFHFDDEVNPGVESASHTQNIPTIFADGLQSVQDLSFLDQLDLDGELSSHAGMDLIAFCNSSRTDHSDIDLLLSEVGKFTVEERISLNQSNTPSTVNDLISLSSQLNVSASTTLTTPAIVPIEETNSQQVVNVDSLHTVTPMCDAIPPTENTDVANPERPTEEATCEPVNNEVPDITHHIVEKIVPPSTYEPIDTVNQIGDQIPQTETTIPSVNDRIPSPINSDESKIVKQPDNVLPYVEAEKVIDSVHLLQEATSLLLKEVDENELEKDSVENVSSEEAAEPCDIDLNGNCSENLDVLIISSNLSKSMEVAEQIKPIVIYAASESENICLSEDEDDIDYSRAEAIFPAKGNDYENFNVTSSPIKLVSDKKRFMDEMFSQGHFSYNRWQSTESEANVDNELVEPEELLACVFGAPSPSNGESQEDSSSEDNDHDNRTESCTTSLETVVDEEMYCCKPKLPDFCDIAPSSESDPIVVTVCVPPCRNDLSSDMSHNDMSSKSEKSVTEVTSSSSEQVSGEVSSMSINSESMSIHTMSIHINCVPSSDELAPEYPLPPLECISPARHLSSSTPRTSPRSPTSVIPSKVECTTHNVRPFFDLKAAPQFCNHTYIECCTDSFHSNLFRSHASSLSITFDLLAMSRKSSFCLKAREGSQNVWKTSYKSDTLDIQPCKPFFPQAHQEEENNNLEKANEGEIVNYRSDNIGGELTVEVSPIRNIHDEHTSDETSAYPNDPPSDVSVLVDSNTFSTRVGELEDSCLSSTSPEKCNSGIMDCTNLCSSVLLNSREVVSDEQQLPLSQHINHDGLPGFSLNGLLTTALPSSIPQDHSDGEIEEEEDITDTSMSTHNDISDLNLTYLSTDDLGDTEPILNVCHEGEVLKNLLLGAESSSMYHAVSAEQNRLDAVLQSKPLIPLIVPKLRINCRTMTCHSVTNVAHSDSSPSVDTFGNFSSCGSQSSVPPTEYPLPTYNHVVHEVVRSGPMKLTIRRRQRSDGSAISATFSSASQCLSSIRSADTPQQPTTLLTHNMILEDDVLHTHNIHHVSPSPIPSTKSSRLFPSPPIKRRCHHPSLEGDIHTEDPMQSCHSVNSNSSESAQSSPVLLNKSYRVASQTATSKIFSTKRSDRRSCTAKSSYWPLKRNVSHVRSAKQLSKDSPTPQPLPVCPRPLTRSNFVSSLKHSRIFSDSVDVVSSLYY